VAKTAPPAAEPARKPATPSAPQAQPPTQVAMAPAPAPAPPPAPAEKPVIPGLPPAADSLARQAEQQRQTGDYSGAAASLERSLRIAPREAYLWNRLARVRMEQGLSAQAGQLAARSNDLAGSQAAIKKDNWRIIAESRRRAGDTVGAGEAEQRAGGG
jgi:tetratricopeptide (TPR) repeat protein